MSLPEEQREEIKTIWLNFLERRLDTITKINLDKIDKYTLSPNPFMLCAITPFHSFESSKKVIEYLVLSKIYAGNETAYGFAIQNTILTFPNTRRVKKVREINIEIEKKGKLFAFRTKAGPNTLNATMARTISSAMKKYTEKTGIQTGLAITYGLPRRISEIIRRHFIGHLVLVGTEFWQYLSGSANCYLEIFAMIKEAQSIFTKQYGEEISELISNRINEIAADFEQTFSKEDPIDSLIRMGFE